MDVQGRRLDHQVLGGLVVVQLDYLVAVLCVVVEGGFALAGGVEDVVGQNRKLVRSKDLKLVSHFVISLVYRILEFVTLNFGQLRMESVKPLRVVVLSWVFDAYDWPDLEVNIRRHHQLRLQLLVTSDVRYSLFHLRKHKSTHRV